MTPADVVIEGGLVWVGPGELHEDGVVHVQAGTIVYAGPRGGEQVPAGTPRINAEGCTVLPGLIDAHVHLTTNSDHNRVVPATSSGGR